MPNTGNILTFAHELFSSFLSFFANFLALWNTQLRIMFSTSAVANIPVLGWIGEVILDGFLGDITLGGLVLGSVSLVLVVTFAKWLLK